MHRGWVRLWRKSRDSAVYTDDLWRVFCHCIMRANLKDTSVPVDGLHDPIEVKRGQFITGRHAFHEEMYLNSRKAPISASTLWRRLQTLAKLGNLNIDTNSRFSLITVCEYETYNPLANETEQTIKQPGEQPLNSRWTAAEQPLNTEKKAKKVKKAKKAKKKPPTPKGDSLDSVTYPDSMDTPEVRQAITTWLAHKKKRGESYKDPADQIGLLLASPRFNRDPATFVAAVDHSKGNNWAGCFPPKESDRGNQTTDPGSTYTPGATGSGIGDI